ncbi:MAG: hypothetical protein ABW133_25355 [Polyangiaceae bacterium]
MFRSALLLLLLGAAPKEGDAPPPPAANLTLRMDAPDVAGPWKMVVTNQGDVPLRFAADGRLLSLEIEAPVEESDAPYGKPGAKKKAPPPVTCKLPAELRPAAVVEDRAIVLAPGARYEEVISPVFYCFSDTEAKALVPGARVTAKLGFSDGTKPNPKTPLRAPFIAEPAAAGSSVTAVKEIAAESFVVAAARPVAPFSAGEASDDPNAPRLELLARTRVDSVDEKTVATTLTVKNTGGRDVRGHMRRDNLLFDIDGPDGSSHCGHPSSRRAVPRENFETIAAGSSRSFEVWIGEMCPNFVFDRPGLYRVRAGLAFPSAVSGEGSGVWSKTIVIDDPILVRIRKGRLPFYTSPPQIFGNSG